MSKDMIVKNMSFKVGQTLTIGAFTRPDAGAFAINIGPNDQDIALHINPRFHGCKNTLVCNSYQGGSWGEERFEGVFPYQRGEEFEIDIKFTCTEFVVTSPRGPVICFPNRMGAEEYSVLCFKVDVCVRSFEIK